MKYGLIEPRVLQRVKRKFVQISWELIRVSNAMEALLLSLSLKRSLSSSLSTARIESLDEENSVAGYCD